MKSNFHNKKKRKETKTKELLQKNLNKETVNEPFLGFQDRLHWLCSNKHPTIEMIDLMLGYGLTLNKQKATKHFGKTALHLMCSRNDLTKNDKKCVLYLIQKGSVPFLQTNKAENCFDLLIRKNRLYFCSKVLITFFQTQIALCYQKKANLPFFLKVFNALQNKELDEVDRLFEKKLAFIDPEHAKKNQSQNQPRFQRRARPNGIKPSAVPINIPLTLLDYLILCLGMNNKNQQDLQTYEELIADWIDKIISYTNIFSKQTKRYNRYTSYRSKPKKPFLPNLHFLFNKKNFNQNIFNLLIQKGLDINMKIKKKTFLEYCLLNKKPSVHMIEFLLTNKAKLNTKFEKNAFHVFFQKKSYNISSKFTTTQYIELFELLLKFDHDLNLKEWNNYKTPAHFFLTSRIFSTKLFKYLVKKGTNLHIKDAYNETVLEILFIFQNITNDLFNFLKENNLLFQINQKQGTNTSTSNTTDLVPISDTYKLFCFYCLHSKPKIEIINYFIQNENKFTQSSKTRTSPFLSLFSNPNVQDLNVDLLGSLLIKGFNILDTDHRNQNFLHLILSNEKLNNSNLEIIEFLINYIRTHHKTDLNMILNSRNKLGQTPLHSICSNTHQRKNKFIKFIDLLIVKNNCDVNSTNDKDSALHLLTYNNSITIETLKIFLQNEKLNLNLKNKDGNTILHLLCKYNLDYERSESRYRMKPKTELKLQTLQLIELLIIHGCDVNLLNNNKDSALHLLTYNNSITIETLKIFLQNEKLNLNLKNKDGNTILHLLCKYNLDYERSESRFKNKKKTNLKLQTIKLIELLMRNDCNVNLINNNKDTALHLLMNSNAIQIKTLEIFLQNEKLNPNLKNSDGNTTLHLFCQNNYLPLRLDIVQLYINKGFDINSLNNDLDTILHIITNKRELQFQHLTFFHKNGAKFNLYKNDKYSILTLYLRKNYQWSASAIDERIILFFIQNGSNLNDLDSFRYTTFQLICACQPSLKLFILCIKKGYKIDKSLMQFRNTLISITKFNYFSFQLLELVFKSALLSPKNIDFSFVPLRELLLFSKIKISNKLIQYLIKKGLDINKKYPKKINQGTTPDSHNAFHYLLQNKDLTAQNLQFLIDKGAIFNSSQLRSHINELHLYCSENRNVNIDVLKILIKYVDINQIDGFRRTPIIHLIKKNLTVENGRYVNTKIQEIVFLLKNGTKIIDYENNISLLNFVCYELPNFDLIQLLVNYHNNNNNNNNNNDNNNNDNNSRNTNNNNLNIMNFQSPFLNKNSPLHFICLNPNPSFETIKYLIEKGADPNLRNSKNETALIILMGRYTLHFKIIDYLLKITNINQDEHKKILAFLLQLRKNLPFKEPNSRNSQYRDHLYWIKAFLKMGWDINTLDITGNPFINIYSSYTISYPSVFKFLIQNNAKANLFDRRNRTALSNYLSRTNLNFEIINLLIQQCKKNDDKINTKNNVDTISHSLHSYCLLDNSTNIKVFQLFGENGVNFNYCSRKNPQQKTILSLVCNSLVRIINNGKKFMLL
ncbi:ankyrin repeat-containing protein [Anaeramoeba flamelloides]|uniref:Ankyrin repeat-containing protein n=1 Tax=Anaeramoeba flamelloides TaxID=1746091 RepID=A0ABQ8XVI3_9EUKA|nr:ankyrin repeat-containing protein [Anaeramoeba flamelloides]